MKKRFYSIGVAMLLCIAAIAGPVTPKEARQKALQFMNKNSKKNVKAVKMAGNVTKGVITDATTIQDYYVFNAEENNSFVIISGEDRLPEVFGYGENGCLDTKNMPENMKTILDMYARLVKYVASKPEGYTPRNISLTARQAKNDIPKIMKSEWDQGSPYNRLCPQDGYNRSYTGCAATSMAQVMYHHKWPEKACKQIPSYYSETLKRTLDGLPETTFKWEKMKDTYSRFTPDPDKAVATLMQYCGYSIEMSYSYQGSGAYSFYQPYALRKYFGYDKKTRLLNRDDFNLEVWNNIIYNELAEGRPVVYSGVTTKNEGHSFVIDGYRKSDGFYHVNWGWSSTSDSYFDITILNPDNTSSAGSASTNEGFSIEQDAIIGMQKPTGEQGEFEEYMDSHINSLKNNIIDCSYFNFTPNKNSFDLGIGCYDNDGNIVVLKKEYSYEFNSLTYAKSVKYDLKQLINTPGKYKVFPICKLSSAQKWQPGDATDYIYVEATLDTDGNLKSVMYPLAELHVDKMELSDPTAIHEEMTATYTIVNEKDETRECVLSFMAKSEDVKDIIKKEVKFETDAKETKTVVVKFTPKRNGNYRFILAYDKEYNSCISDETHKLGGIEPKLESDFVIEDCNSEGMDNFVYSNVAKGNLVIKNNGEKAYIGKIRIQLARRKKNGMNTIEKKIEKPVKIEKSATMEIPFEFKKLTIDKKYALIFSYEFNDYVKAKEYVFTAKDANTNAIETPETAVQNNDNVPVHDIMGRKVNTDGDNLQRGIYIKNGKKHVKK